jgi:hypothetical protein
MARKLFRLSVVFVDSRTGALEVVLPNAGHKVDLTSFGELFDLIIIDPTQSRAMTQ